MDYKKVLDEKFMELSDLFTKIKDDANVEPEQKCVVIKTMIEIFNAFRIHRS